jgi:parallel beta-helix repeat protein
MTLWSPVLSSRIRPVCRLLLGSWIAFVMACAPSDGEDTLGTAENVIQVEPPSGEAETDRTRVQTAFDDVQPGGTVQFAEGTYVLGQGARLTVPDVTVLGHPDGTVLRGCDPAGLEFPEEQGGELDPFPIVQSCTGLFVMADRQTIRGLTFEYAWHGIFVGVAPWLPPSDDTPSATSFGGHRIEDNLFQYTPNGIRVVGPAENPTIIENNVVLNAYHAFQGNGAPIHVVGNRIQVPDPDGVPSSHYPESAVILNDWGIEGAPCTGSIVQGNVVEGTVNGIQIMAAPGSTCSGHEIRDNDIRIGEVSLPETYAERLRDFFFPGAVGSAVAGVPIRLISQPGPPDQGVGRVTDVLVENNRVSGGSGLGIQLLGASGNRIVDNQIAGIQMRDPLNGPTWGDLPAMWEAANGSGVWISAGSDANHLEGNTFEDLAGSAIHIEGADNEVIVGDAEMDVEDRGQDNRIRRP